MLNEAKSKEYGQLRHPLWSNTAPAQPFFWDLGSLPRLGVMAAAFPFEGSTGSKAEHTSQRHRQTHRDRTLTWPVTQPFFFLNGGTLGQPQNEIIFIFIFILLFLFYYSKNMPVILNSKGL